MGKVLEFVVRQPEPPEFLWPHRVAELDLERPDEARLSVAERLMWRRRSREVISATGRFTDDDWRDLVIELRILRAYRELEHARMFASESDEWLSQRLSDLASAVANTRVIAERDEADA
jgi:hypothetical protein